MEKNRLEAFSDGVLAILITIMVLQLTVPQSPRLRDLRDVWPVLLSYVLSFVHIGIYWNNHHHMLAVTRRVSGSVLWANLHLLFWLSLIPFVTTWMGEYAFAPVPTAVYGGVLFCAAVSYYVLARRIVRVEGPDSLLARALGYDWKGKASPFLYVLGIAAAFVNRWLALGTYAFVAAIWLVPDPRIERVVADAQEPPAP